MTYNFRILTAATLVAVLAFATVASASPPPLPLEASKLSAEQFEVWAKRANANAYEIAAKRATPGARVYVERERTSAYNNGGRTYLGWGSGVYIEPTFRETDRVTSKRFYELNGYGGGPVWLVNPYCKEKK